ncbi:MAG: tRNA (adenosine(37)-N6)-threonylcarbamoyltransferase complex transferase subunit TsaD [Candidatus Colwellbacteria bacterium]|nr:tRNA (adenosine(37)-N6)-threonylcarbamoyltransferase complex transferase subunit TsaD [Candidatus Colwellbacteria bacterium]
MRILAIETSCDESAIALVEATGTLIRNPRFNVLANLISSQVKVHRPFGGVVPNLAKREHIKNLPLLLQQLETKNLKLETIDLIVVTVGPGLEPALWTGINFAEDLAKKLEKSILGVNHLEGHLYSFLLEQKAGLQFPAMVLSVSGGHTMLIHLEKLGQAKKIGETRDDAAGEAFDKVARLLGLPYPGGPEIEKLAKKGDENAIDFPRPMIHQKNFDFSFSGIKTSVLYYIRDLKLKTLNLKQKADIAASFQKAVSETLVAKTIRAAEEFGVKSIALVGGVSANKYLTKKMEKAAKNIGLAFTSPQLQFNTDNAAMIAAAAYINTLKKKKIKNKIEANSNLNL